MPPARYRRGRGELAFMRPRTGRRAIRGILAVILMLCLVEVGIRLSRATDVPLYEADSRQGYIPKANQSGAFLWTRQWAFNEKHMGTEHRFVPSSRPDILLIGDSVVLGGNPFRAGERLGPQLGDRLPGTQVWPISAGSWALQNELYYLQNHPEVVNNIDQFVLVSNSEDFGPPSSWKSQITHPTYRPLIRSVYFFRRYILKSDGSGPSTSPVRPQNIHFLFDGFVRAQRKNITVILYPNKKELDRVNPCDFAPDWLINNIRVRTVCVADDAAWNGSLYMDSIHPTPKGVERLSAIIAKHLSIGRGH